MLLLRPGHLLLTRRSPQAGYAPGYWHWGVAGKANPGEDVVSAAVRESHEELAVDVCPEDLEFAHMMQAASPGQSWLHAFFVCRRWAGEPINAEPAKHSNIEWFRTHQPPHGLVDYAAQALRHMLIGTRFSQHGTPTPFPAPAEDPPTQQTLGDAGVDGALARALTAIADERRRQETLYGIQNLPTGAGAHYAAAAQRAQRRVDRAGSDLTWANLAEEEFREACATSDLGQQRQELVQLAAVVVQWIQYLERTIEPGDRSVVREG